MIPQPILTAVHGNALLENRLCELLARPDYRPLRHHELAAALHLKRDDKQAMRRALRELERQGRVICLRKNRWALPSPVRQTRAILKGLLSGGARALPLETPGEEYMVARDAMAGAIDGDQVVIEPLRSRRGRTETMERASARVLRVLERAGRTVAGTLLKGHGYWYIIPDHPRISTNVHIVGWSQELPPPTLHHTVVVRLDDWKGPGSALSGTAVEDLGPSEAAGVGLLSLMRNRGLDARFEGGVDHEARQRPAHLAPADIEGREDYREWITFTIDPADARDFDDAISLRRMEGDRWEAGIHIADVAYFVSPNSEVDREAHRRGNSVYLVGGFVPMLPPYLTSDVCSLRPAVDRLTHSVILQLDDQGRVVSKRTARSVIHSKARLNYDQVQTFMDHGTADAAMPEAVQTVLRDIIPLARRLRQRRMKAGSIDLAMPEVTCDLDAEGKATAFHRRGSPEAYHLIEEFMLLANVAVAEILTDQRVPALYRIHEPPTDEQWAKMAEDLAQLGLTRAPTDPASINQLCREVAGTPMEYPANLAVLRNLKRALYSANRVEHFGLGFSHYTHFTSPIRRYPDLVIHRILCAVEERRRSSLGHQDLHALAQHCSITERNADEAENESLQEQRLAYYATRLEAGDETVYEALITGVVPRGLLVELEDSLQRGLIPLSSLPDDYYTVEMNMGRIKGRQARHTFRVGTRIKVRLLRVDTQRKLVDFRMAGYEASPAPPQTRRPARKKQKPQRRRQRMR